MNYLEHPIWGSQRWVIGVWAISALVLVSAWTGIQTAQPIASLSNDNSVVSTNGITSHGTIPAISTESLPVTPARQTTVARTKHRADAATRSGTSPAGVKGATGLIAGLALLEATQSGR